MFFFPRRNRVPLIRGKSSGEQFLRFMALMAIFAITGWLFWLNNQKSMERILADGTVVDLGDQLSPEQKQTLRDFATLFKDEFGLDLRVHVSAKFVDPPAPDNKTLFIGINPKKREVVLQLPPLVSNALGAELSRTLGGDHFTPYFDSGQWPQGLIAALKRIWKTLASLKAPTEEPVEHRYPVERKAP